MDGVITWAALAASIAVGGGLGGWVWRLADRLGKSDAKADAAKIVADSASIALAAARLETAAVARDLNEHKVIVARDYASNAAMQHLEAQIMSGFKTVNDRLDAVLLQRS